MSNVKDIVIAVLTVFLLVVGYFAMWIYVLLFVGFLIYLSIPIAKNILKRRPRKWK